MSQSSLLRTSQKSVSTEAEQPHSTRPLDEVIRALRTEIESGARDLDSILGTITVAAQLLTGADGAALAMLRDERFVCMGRSGDVAPELGAIVNTESGITGECLRTGDALLCSDAASDPRVDAAVCRRLGLRSIAVAPIRGKQSMIGLLEIFATAADVFTADHLNTLSVLGELVPAAEYRNDTDTVGAENLSVAQGLASIARPSQEPHGGMRSRIVAYRKPVMMGSTVGLVILLGALAWKTWTQPKPAESAAATSVSTDTRDSGATMPTDPQPASDSMKPSPVRVPEARAERGVVSAASVEIARDVVRPVAVNVPQPASAERKPAASETTEVEKAPEVIAGNSASDSLNGLLAYSVPTPKFSPRVSGGVVPARLEKRVPPTYPAQARSAGLEGEVSLIATIGEDGSVKNVRAIRGNQVLAKAAVTAVKRWHYRPATLNGNPVPVETEITVKFNR